MAEVARSVTHGIAQGAISAAQGGDFGSGFFGAAVGHAVGSYLNVGRLKGPGLWKKVARTVAAAVAGGAGAAAAGGKFKNGAVSAAFVHLFNNEGGAEKIKREWFKILGYDPDGISENTNMWLNPTFAIAAKIAASDAFDATDSSFPGISAWNNEADAFRHAFWNYKMAKTMGVDRAKLFADAHERYSRNAVGETIMDLHNNNVGRQLFIGNPTGNPTSIIQNAINVGKLMLRPAM